MALNLAAILTNGGRMPATPEAMEAAGLNFAVKHNSVAAAEPNLSWLVDRFAAPDWVPLTNVYSVGDVIIALGAVVLVFSATGARLPRLPRRAPSSRPAEAERPPCGRRILGRCGEVEPCSSSSPSRRSPLPRAGTRCAGGTSRRRSPRSSPRLTTEDGPTNYVPLERARTPSPASSTTRTRAAS